MADDIKLTVDISGANKKILDFTASKKEKIKNAVIKSALNIQRNAKRECPVDTGALRNSISVSFESDYGTFVSAEMPYAAYVEYGTKNMEAQPYMRPAAEAEVAKLKSEIEND